MTKPQSEGLTAVRCSIWLGRGRLASAATRESPVLMCSIVMCVTFSKPARLRSCESHISQTVHRGLTYQAQRRRPDDESHNPRALPPFAAASG